MLHHLKCLLLGLFTTQQFLHGAVYTSPDDDVTIDTYLAPEAIGSNESSKQADQELSTDRKHTPYSRPKYSHVVSLKIHAKLVTESYEIPFVVMKKEQDKIRSTVDGTKGLTSFITVYNQERMFNMTEVQSEYKQVAVSGDEAAAQLFDMLMLNPEYHFAQLSQFDLSTTVFDGYKVELQKVEETIDESTIERITGAKLFAPDNQNNATRIIRSVSIQELKPFQDAINEPSLLVYIDEETQETSTIEVLNVVYNSGLGDFVFATPVTSQQ